MGASLAERHQESEIAIIGMSGRFPGSSNLGVFWRNLREGVESISFFSKSELECSGVAPELFNDPQYVPARGILKDIDRFDASFFGFSPREAEIMDPQHRLFLECAWEALEGAGYYPERVDGPIGVFAGSKLNQYALAQLNATGAQALDEIGIRIGNSKDFLPTQVSYKLNLMGPSINVQTACSTSLVAVHLACQSLLAGECDLALAGGVAVTVPQKTGYLYQEGGIASPDGHCRAFDAKARGTVGGNGVGIVVLKRLEEALADGDEVHAVVKGSAINNDGSAKVGYTAPSVDGQAAVIEEALAAAGVPPETISYVEAHGTGTRLGDPIEIAALTQAFSTANGRRGFCALGSLKTNVGHLDPAAGIGGLIKTVLALKHQEIPPSLHFEEPNPEIDFASGSFYVNTVLQPWPRGATPRRAGVSSFGIGGTNAHVVLEEAPPLEPSGESRSRQLLVLSAKTPSALETATANLGAHLRETVAAGCSVTDLADMAYTLQIGRGEFEHRRMLVVCDGEDVRSVLETLDPRRVLTRCRKQGELPVIFMFPGEGAADADMGRELYEQEPGFRRQVDRCAELIEPLLGRDLRPAIYPPTELEDEADPGPLPGTLIEPARFVVEYALAQLFMGWGIRPEAMIGQGVGEYVVACLAGVFGLEEALTLAVLRGRLQSPPEAGGGIAPFVEGLEKIALRSPSSPYLSGVTGTWITAAEATDPSYWIRHLRHADRVADALVWLLKDPESIFLEVGPGRELTDLLRQQAGWNDDRTVLPCLPACRHRESGVELLLTTLGQLWLAGSAINWHAFTGHECRRRVPLPTYPFERRSYWIEPRIAGGGNGVADSQRSDAIRSTGKRPDLNDWTYVPCWRRTPPPVPVNPPELAPPHSGTPWLLLMDNEGLGQRIAERLARQRWRVITVAAGETFSGQDVDRYTLDPTASGDYDALLDELERQGLVPERIAHLWAVGECGAENLGQATPESSEVVARELGFFSLLFLVQAWVRKGWDHPLRLDVVSTGLHEVTGEDALSPSKATLLGPVRLLPQEVPHATCRAIDVVLGNDVARSDRLDRLADLLVTELSCGAQDSVVAIRGGHRWIPSFEQVRLASGGTAAAAAAGVQGRRLREGGVYLITGGLGGMGLVLAETLARKQRAKLILVGRSPFPEPEEWQGWLDSHDNDGVSRKIRRLQALRDAGAEVMVASADVADRERMTAVVERAREQFGRIHGVVHAAGIAGGGLAGHKTPEMVAEVFAPKITGTRVLESIFKDPSDSPEPEARLDFLVLFSSLSSLTGGLGRVDYAAANAFLDAFALRNALHEEVYTVSINWDTWREVGMAAEEAVRSDLREHWQDRLEQAILPTEGIELFLRVLDSNLPQVIISTRDFPAVLESERSYALSAQLTEQVGKRRKARATHPRPRLYNAYVEPENDLERQIAHTWQEMLGLDRVGIHDNFLELGGHSLLATQIVSRLRRSLGIEISLQQFFAAATVTELAAFIAENRRENSSAMISSITFNDRVKGRL